MGSDHKFLDQFNHHFVKINEALDENFSSRIPLMKNIGHHSLLGEGKRLRPLLFVLASELCGYRGADVYKLSTIFEYIHTASLLHDDVLDNAELRKGESAGAGSLRASWRGHGTPSTPLRSGRRTTSPTGSGRSTISRPGMGIRIRRVGVY